MPSTYNFVTTDAAAIYTAIVGSLMDEVNEPLYPGDERRIFAEALVAVLVSVYNEFNDRMKQRTLQYARGPVLDAIADRYGLTRAEPAHASAIFRFTVDVAQPQNIIINQGTRITTDGSMYFATDQIAVLQAGSLHVDIPATCTEGGSAHNGYTAGTINTLVDLIPYISGAENTTISAGGDDGEPYTDEGDEKFRERIRLAPATQSTAGPESAYRYFALSADPGIIDVAIDVPDANIVNIYPLMTDGELPDEDVLAKVEAACSADNVRPMTDKVTAIAPEAVTYDVEIKYYCTQDNEADTVNAVEGSGGAIERYNEWQTAALDRDINPDQLRRYILAPNWATGLVGADRVNVIKPTFAEIGKQQVAKFSGSLKVMHEVTE